MEGNEGLSPFAISKNCYSDSILLQIMISKTTVLLKNSFLENPEKKK